MVIPFEKYKNKYKGLVSMDPDELDFNNVLEEGEVYWMCGCGHTLFFIGLDGAICQVCGELQRWDDWDGSDEDH